MVIRNNKTGYTQLLIMIILKAHMLRLYQATIIGLHVAEIYGGNHIAVAI